MIWMNYTMTENIRATVNTLPSNDEAYKVTILKIGDMNVHVRSSFYAEKNLYDILLSIASLKLKEKSA